MEYLNVALPKGRIGNLTAEMFTKLGFKGLDEIGHTRKLILEDEKNKIRFFLVKPSDVTTYVEYGSADIGVVGKDVILEEKNKFVKTLAHGEREFNKEMQKAKQAGTNVINGQVVFRLYDTYGFPPEVTKELAEENGFQIDLEEFEKLFKQHQEKSRAGSEHKFKGGLADQTEETIAYHTATHLLNAALKQIIGKDAHQRGSNITAERMRFDFNCDHKLTPEEKKAVEDLVNKWIQEGIPVTKQEMSKEEAIKSGAECMFIEKYPDIVTVYSIGDVSKELCGGPHVSIRMN